MKNRLTILLLSLLLFVFCGSPVSAEEISSMFTSVDVLKNGKIRVREEIVYDFGSLNRHGIYRDISYLKKNKAGKQYRMDIDVLSVTDNNEVPYKYSVTRTDNNEIRVKVGDANVYVGGMKIYNIAYEVSGAITYFSDHDEIYWNMTGNSWEVPILKASYRVTFPQQLIGADITTVCYTGATDSQSRQCTGGYVKGGAEGEMTGMLSAREGLTAAVSFPPDIVAHLEPKEIVNFFDTFLGKIVIALMAILGFIWYVLLPLAIPYLWYRSGRDPKADVGEVRAWYDPPQTKYGKPLGPGETGLLVDENVDMRDIFSILIDLARRGNFRIVEEKKGDFYLKKGMKDNGDLRDYETILMNGLFEEGDDVRLKDRELAGTVEKVKDKLYTSMTSSGFFPRNPNTVRMIWIGIGAAALFTGNIFLAFVSFVFGRVMPKKTSFGAGQANIGRSLKNFLATQERQLEFQAKNQMFFEKLLPFAIAFGVEKVWADRFKDINLRSPDWYQGYNRSSFSTAYFMGSMNSSFSSFRSSATPTSSSSGFSSGFSGGSSGGGGGGGGGGSW